MKNAIYKKVMRVVIAIITATALTGASIAMSPSANAYNGSNAASYARNYYQKYNPEYNKYSSDCTNFASQAAYAGGEKKTNPTKISTGVTGTSSYWYSYKYSLTKKILFWTTTKEGWAESSTWVRVAGGQGFYDYFKSRKTLTVTKDYGTIRANARLGDIVQVMAKGESAKSHSMVVGDLVKAVINGKTGVEVVFYYHTNDTRRTLPDFDNRYGKGTGTNTYTVYKM